MKFCKRNLRMLFIYTHMCIHMPANIHTHTHTHTHTYIYTQRTAISSKSFSLEAMSINSSLLTGREGG